MYSSMEVDNQNGWFDVLHADEPDRWHAALTWIKNSVIGNNKQKINAINHGVIPRLLQWLVDDEALIQLRVDAAIILGSIAKGTQEEINTLVDQGCVPILLKGLNSQNLPYVEACLRCLRTIFISNSSNAYLLYQDNSVIPKMVAIMPQSVCTQECVANIIANTCKGPDHQNKVCRSGIIPALAVMLGSNVYKVQMPTLKCMAVLLWNNEDACITMAAASHTNGEQVPDLLIRLMLRDKTSEMQIAAAKCLAYMCKGGAIEPRDSRIVLKTLPCLVRMCGKDRTLEENVDGAETLAVLVEVHFELQKVAAISDHIIKTLAGYLNTNVQQINSNGKSTDIDWGNEMKQAAFKAFAALGGNEEDIRKQIIETENLMEHIITGLNSNNTKVVAAAIRCLHSLSRSVQLLRTTFQDHAIWRPIMKIIKDGPEEVLYVASSTLCNLLLEFSPSKECIVESGAVGVLIGLAGNGDVALRLNGVWGLMNMTFQADYKVKQQVVESIGTEQLFRLLSDPDPNILMKTLGLLRNLLTNKMHIDSIMNVYGNQIMQAVIFILEGDHSPQIKEQTLCILANVADGEQAKDVIMSNEDVLKKLMNYMLHLNVNLQIAATFCIFNLVWTEEEGAYQRQAKLREMGVQKLLQQLLGTCDSALYDKVKMALQQFT